MISVLWIVAGGAAAIGVAQTIASALRQGNNENENDDSEKKSDRNCYNCNSFDRNAWEKRHIDKDGNEVAADKDTYKVYCPNTCKEYRISSRGDIEKKMLCGKEYNHRYR